jgi:hypothetical protein
MIKAHYYFIFSTSNCHFPILQFEKGRLNEDIGLPWLTKDGNKTNFLDEI